MNISVRRAARAGGVLLIALSIGFGAHAALAAVVPETPEDLELTAGADSSITIEWEPSEGHSLALFFR